MSGGIVHRCGSDIELLWLWCRPVATAPVQLLPLEPPYAMSAALERPSPPKKELVNGLNNFLKYFFKAAPVAHGSSQARGRIRAAAAGLHHSHSNTGSETHLPPTLQLVAMPDP